MVKLQLWLLGRFGVRGFRGCLEIMLPPGGTEGSNPGPSGSQSVSLVPSATTGTKGPAFAANVSLDETRERDMQASDRLAFDEVSNNFGSLRWRAIEGRRRQPLLARTYLQPAVEPDLHRRD